MKVYISADMEGITGVVDGDQTGGPSGDYTRARRWMTDDVNAAIEGALKTGAREIHVKDAHGSGRNILLEHLNKEAHLIAGWDPLMSMVQGIDETFDALILIGYHSMAGTENGILMHTFAGCVRELRFNDRPVGESAISALTAGQHGVPTVFVSGDQTVVAEVTGLIGEMPYAITKYGMARESGRTIHPETARKAIMNGVSEALSDVNRFEPFQMDLPIQMSLELTSLKMADLIGLLPGVDRPSADKVIYQAEDVAHMLKIFRVMVGLAWSQK